MSRKAVTTRGARSKGATRKVSKRSAPSERRPAVWGRVLAVMLVMALVPAAVLGGQQVLEYLEARRVEVLKVEGPLANVREADIRTALLPAMDTSLIYIDLEQLQSRLERIDWVNVARIRREWPDTLHIQVTEQRAIARWRDEALLSEEGSLFSPEDVGRYLKLPYLAGPDGQEYEVMNHYRRFSSVLYSHGLKIASLEVNARGSWSLRLSNGISLQIGHEDEMLRMRRFAGWLEMRGPDAMKQVAQVDLRYPNGIAVMAVEQEHEAVVSL